MLESETASRPSRSASTTRPRTSSSWPPIRATRPSTTSEQGCNVGVESFSGSTIVWQALAQDLHGRTLGEAPDDLQMAITDFDLAPELVLAGDLCAGVTSIYNAMGRCGWAIIAGLYDNKSASQLYGTNTTPVMRG